MRNPGSPDHEKVRINFARSVLNEASQHARSKGLTLSGYIEGLVLDDLGMNQLALGPDKHSNGEER